MTADGRAASPRLPESSSLPDVESRRPDGVIGPRLSAEGLGPSPSRGTVAGNPRIDELRRKLDKEPGSRLFAQLAEELRKDGDLEDAIQVAREGLQKHSNYPSARMTLGRALFDTGDWSA